MSPLKKLNREQLENVKFGGKMPIFGVTPLGELETCHCQKMVSVERGGNLNETMSARTLVKEIQIRPMQQQDLEQVNAIDQVSFDIPWPASAFRYELMENPASFLLAAEAKTLDGQDQVCGVIVVWLVMDEAHIATLAVHPDHRNEGIGQKLVVAALQEAVRRGALTATLEVRAQNTIAQALYHRLRFKVVGRRPGYYQDNSEDALLMTVSNLRGNYLEWLDGEWQ